MITVGIRGLRQRQGVEKGEEVVVEVAPMVVLKRVASLLTVHKAIMPITKATRKARAVAMAAVWVLAAVVWVTAVSVVGLRLVFTLGLKALGTVVVSKGQVEVRATITLALAPKGQVSTTIILALVPKGQTEARATIRPRAMGRHQPMAKVNSRATTTVLKCMAVLKSTAMRLNAMVTTGRG